MAVDYKDYYAILGVNKDASAKEIKQAFRKLARQHHPDVNPNDKSAEERFKEINEANEVLSDPEKRQKYDEMRQYYQQYGQWPGATSGAGGSGNGGFESGGYHYQTFTDDDLRDIFGEQSPFSDFFETYFGTSEGTRAQTARGRGQPLLVKMLRQRLMSRWQKPIPVSQEYLN